MKASSNICTRNHLSFKMSCAKANRTRKKWNSVQFICLVVVTFLLTDLFWRGYSKKFSFRHTLPDFIQSYSEGKRFHMVTNKQIGISTFTSTNGFLKSLHRCFYVFNPRHMRSSQEVSLTLTVPNPLLLKKGRKKIT